MGRSVRGRRGRSRGRRFCLCRERVIGMKWFGGGDGWDGVDVRGKGKGRGRFG